MVDVLIITVLVTLVAVAAKFMAARLEKEYAARQAALRSLYDFTVKCGGECITHTLPFMSPENRGRVVVKILGPKTLEINSVVFEIHNGIEYTE